MALKVVYANIEFDRHLEAVLSFLQAERADVIFLNEILEPDIPHFESVLGMSSFFAPQMIFTVSRGAFPLGQAAFSRLPMQNKNIPYAGVSEIVLAPEDPVSMVTAQRYQLLLADIETDGVSYRLGLTHFPWTKDGEASDYQRNALSKLFGAVQGAGEMALFGDFNAPRGKEIFELLAERYRDNVPLSYRTSLDGHLHRVGWEKYKKEKMDTFMVDGCFTTDGYRAHNVHLVFGISDHAAVVAEIEKTEV